MVRNLHNLAHLVLKLKRYFPHAENTKYETHPPQMQETKENEELQVIEFSTLDDGSSQKGGIDRKK
jgi:hypothetical protein